MLRIYKSECGQWVKIVLADREIVLTIGDWAFLIANPLFFSAKLGLLTEKDFA